MKHVRRALVVTWCVLTGCGLKDYSLDGRIPEGGNDAVTDAASDAVDVTPEIMLVTPRQIAPMSTAMVTSPTPWFAVTDAGASTSTEVQLCAQPGCASPMTVTGVGARVVANVSLHPGAWFWRARTTAPGGAASGYSPWWEFFVTHAHAGPGNGYGTVLDVNFDGIPDLIVGASVGSSGTGQIDVYNGTGNDAGIANPVAPQEITAPLSSGFGVTVTSAGDVNGDGYGDVIVGAPATNNDAGVAFVYYGNASGDLTAMQPTQLGASVPPGTNGQFGLTVAGVGDFDGDGYGDLVVGVPAAPTGEAVVYYGGPNGPSDALSSRHETVPGLTAGDAFGGALAGGDLDADGLADIVITGPTASLHGNSGAITVLHGNANGIGGAARFDVAGPITNGTFGYALAVGDADGDGASDIVVGAPAANLYVGAAFEYGGHVGVPFAAAMPTMLSPTDPLAGPIEFGVSVAVLDGANDDGSGVVAVGASEGGSMEIGQVQVFVAVAGAGLPGNPTTVLDMPTIASGFGRFGSAVANAGDLDGDGRAELAVGAVVPGGPGIAYLYARPFPQTPFVTLNQTTADGGDWACWIASRIRSFTPSG